MICNSQVNVLKQPQLSKSDIFGVLQNDRRRHVLEILHSKGSQSVRSLSEEIARLESKTDEPKTNVRKSIYISLLQTHIPKMENLNVITYDREKDTVKLLPTAQNFDIYMETVKKGDIPWSHFYFGPEHPYRCRQCYNLFRPDQMDLRLSMDALYKRDFLSLLDSPFASLPQT